MVGWLISPSTLPSFRSGPGFHSVAPGNRATSFHCLASFGSFLYIWKPLAFGVDPIQSDPIRSDPRTPQQSVINVRRPSYPRPLIFSCAFDDVVPPPARYEFALVLNPNDEYRDAVEVLELALDLGEGPAGAAGAAAAAGGKTTTSPQKLDKAKRVRESLGGLQNQHQHSSSDSCESVRPNRLRVRVGDGTRGSGSGSDSGGACLFLCTYVSPACTVYIYACIYI